MIGKKEKQIKEPDYLKVISDNLAKLVKIKIIELAGTGVKVNEDELLNKPKGGK